MSSPQISTWRGTASLWCQQVSVFFAKSWKQKIRRPWNTLFEILTPMLILLVLVYGAKMSPESQMPAFNIHEDIVNVSNTSAGAGSGNSGASIMKMMKDPNFAFFFATLLQDKLIDLHSVATNFAFNLLPSLADPESVTSRRLNTAIKSTVAAAERTIIPGLDEYWSQKKKIRKKVGRAGMKSQQHFFSEVYQVMQPGQLAFAPNGRDTRKLVNYFGLVSSSFNEEIFGGIFDSPQQALDTFEGNPLSNNAAANAKEDVSKGGGAAGAKAPKPQQKPLWAIIELVEDFPNVRYKIHMNSTFIPRTTQRTDPFPQGLGSGFAKYVDSGFLTLQFEIGEFFRRVARGPTTANFDSPGDFFTWLEAFCTIGLYNQKSNNNNNTELAQLKDLFVQPKNNTLQQGQLGFVTVEWPEMPGPVVDEPLAQLAIRYPCLYELHKYCNIWNISCLNKYRTSSATKFKLSYSCEAMLEAHPLISQCSANQAEKNLNRLQPALMYDVKCVEDVAAKKKTGQTQLNNLGSVVDSMHNLRDACKNYIDICNSNNVADLLCISRALQFGQVDGTTMCGQLLRDAIGPCRDDFGTICTQLPTSKHFYNSVSEDGMFCLWKNRDIVSEKCLTSHLYKEIKFIAASYYNQTLIPTPLGLCRTATRVQRVFKEGITAGAMPADSFIQRDFFKNSIAFFGLIAAMAFMFFFTSTVRMIVQDKEKGSHRLFINLGAHWSSLSCAYCLLAFMIALPMSAVATFILWTIMELVPTTLIFSLILAYAISLITLALFFAQFFTSSKNAAAASPFFMFFCAIPGFIVFSGGKSFQLLLGALSPGIIVAAFEDIAFVAQTTSPTDEMLWQLRKASWGIFGLSFLYFVLALFYQYLCENYGGCVLACASCLKWCLLSSPTAEERTRDVQRAIASQRQRRITSASLQQQSSSRTQLARPSNIVESGEEQEMASQASLNNNNNNHNNNSSSNVAQYSPMDAEGNSSDPNNNTSSSSSSSSSRNYAGAVTNHTKNASVSIGGISNDPSQRQLDREAINPFREASQEQEENEDNNNNQQQQEQEGGRKEKKEKEQKPQQQQQQQLSASSSSSSSSVTTQRSGSSSTTRSKTAVTTTTTKEHDKLKSDTLFPDKIAVQFHDVSCLNNKGLHVSPSLVNCTFAAPKGCLTALVGPSSSGKSQLLQNCTGSQLAVGMERFGKVDVFGEDPATSWQARLMTGICLQNDSALFEQLSALEHVTMVGEIKGMSQDSAETEALSILRALGMPERKIYSRVSELSQGLKRRVSVAMALAGGSRLLLLDSPTAGVDQLGRRKLFTLLSENAGDRCILFSTNFLNEAEEVADWLLLLDTLSCRFCGTPSSLIQQVSGSSSSSAVKKAISMRKLPNCDIGSLQSKIVSALPSSRLLNSVGREVRFEVTAARDFTKIPSLVRELEEADFGVGRLEVSDVSLEDTFMNVIRRGTASASSSSSSSSSSSTRSSQGARRTNVSSNEQRREGDSSATSIFPSSSSSTSTRVAVSIEETETHNNNNNNNNNNTNNNNQDDDGFAQPSSSASSSLSRAAPQTINASSAASAAAGGGGGGDYTRHSDASSASSSRQQREGGGQQDDDDDEDELAPLSSSTRVDEEEQFFPQHISGNAIGTNVEREGRRTEGWRLTWKVSMAIFTRRFASAVRGYGMYSVLMSLICIWFALLVLATPDTPQPALVLDPKHLLSPQLRHHGGRQHVIVAGNKQSRCLLRHENLTSDVSQDSTATTDYPLVTSFLDALTAQSGGSTIYSYNSSDFAFVNPNNNKFSPVWNVNLASGDAVKLSNVLRDTIHRHPLKRYGSLFLNDDYVIFKNNYSHKTTFIWRTDTVLHNSTIVHALPTFVNSLQTLRMQAVSNNSRASIELIVSPILNTNFVWSSVTVAITLITALLVLVPFVFVPAKYIASTVQERESKFHAVESASLLTVWSYWWSTFIWHCVAYTCFSLAATCVMALFQQKTGGPRGPLGSIGYIFALVEISGCCFIVIGYAIGFFFKSHATALNFIINLAFLYGFALVAAVTAIDITSPSAESQGSKDFNSGFEKFLQMFPPFALGKGFLDLALLPVQQAYGLHLDKDAASVVTDSVLKMTLFPIWFFIFIFFAALWRTQACSEFLEKLWNCAPCWKNRSAMYIASRPATSEVEDLQFQLFHDSPVNVRGSSTSSASSSSSSSSSNNNHAPPRSIEADDVHKQFYASSSSTSSSSANKTEDVAVNDGADDGGGGGGGGGGAVDALRGVSLVASPGQKLVIVGENGAGSSTLLSVLSGEMRASSGVGAFDGHDVFLEEQLVYSVRRHFGVCPSSTNPSSMSGEPFDEDLTPYLLFQHMADMRGMRVDKHREQHIEFLLRALGLFTLRNKSAWNLANGEKRRVSVGLAMVGFPRVIFLDNPSNQLDPISRRFLFAAMQCVPSECIIVISSSHVEEAHSIATHAAILRSGRLIWNGGVSNEIESSLMKGAIVLTVFKISPANSLVSSSGSSPSSNSSSSTSSSLQQQKPWSRSSVVNDNNVLQREANANNISEQANSAQKQPCGYELAVAHIMDSFATSSTTTFKVLHTHGNNCSSSYLIGFSSSSSPSPSPSSSSSPSSNQQQQQQQQRNRSFSSGRGGSFGPSSSAASAAAAAAAGGGGEGQQQQQQLRQVVDPDKPTVSSVTSSMLEFQKQTNANFRFSVRAASIEDALHVSEKEFKCNEEAPLNLGVRF